MIRYHILVIGLLLCLVGFSLGNAFGNTETGMEGRVVSEIVVKAQGLPGDLSYWAVVARDLLVLREGGLFTAEALNASLDALRKSNLFEKIDVPDPKIDDDQVILSFIVTPFPRIKKIFIKGGFPLLRKEIRDAINLHSGAAFEKEKIAAKEAIIVELFQQEGYIRPEASIVAEQDPGDGKMVVTVNIDKGPYYRVQQVAITGNHGFSDGRLKLRLNTWKACLLFGEMQRFRKKDLAEDVRNLRQFYRQQRYPEMTLETQVDKNDDTGVVRVTFAVQEGPRYYIVFEGNDNFWDLTLKQDLVLFKEGNKNDFGLRKSVQKMRRRYKQAGFLDARLQVVSEDTKEKGRPIRNIRIVITEGPRHIVDTITISGNTVLGEKEIRSDMLTRRPGFFKKGQFVPQVLKEDIQAIVSSYLKKGYMNVQVTEQVGKKQDDDSDQILVDVSLQIDEGIQTKVTSVVFEGLTALTESEALEAVALKTGEPFREYMIKSDENTLSALISEKGFPHVKVAGAVQLSETQSHAMVTYTVEKGPFVKMGEVFHSGNIRTKARVIRKAAKLSPGEPFSLKKMLAAQRNIRNIEAFGSVRLRTVGLKEKAQKVDLLAEIEEKRPYYLQLGAGYDTERRLFGHSRIGDQNLFGLNKDLWVGGEISEIGYRGEGEITEPRLFQYPVSAKFNLAFEEQEPFNKDFGTRTTAASLSFSHKFLKNYRATLPISYERRRQFKRDGEIPPGEEEKYERRGILTVRPSIVFDSRDSFMRPQKGFFTSLAFGVSKGLENSFDDFLKPQLDMKYFRTPWEGLTLAFRGRAGHIFPFETSSNIPEDQLFFLGGTSSVRGFKENLLRYNVNRKAVGGRTELLASVEARIYLGLNFELTPFLDTGSVRNAIVDEGSDDFRYSTGLGLKYISPLGSIGITYGHKLDRKENEPAGRFHFIIGYAF